MALARGGGGRSSVSERLKSDADVDNVALGRIDEGRRQGGL